MFVNYNELSETLRLRMWLLNPHEYESYQNAGVSGETAVLLHAPENDKEFKGLSLEKINDSTMMVAVNSDSKIKLIPAITIDDGVARRDQNFHAGDTLMTDEVRMILEKTERISAQIIRVEIRDRSFLPIYYDGKEFQY